MGYDQGMANVILAPRSTQILCPLKKSVLVWAFLFTLWLGQLWPCPPPVTGYIFCGVILSYQWKVWRPNPWLWLLGGVWLWQSWLCHLSPLRQSVLCISCCPLRSHHLVMGSSPSEQTAGSFVCRFLGYWGSCCPELASWTSESAIAFLLVVWHWLSLKLSTSSILRYWLLLNHFILLRY